MKKNIFLNLVLASLAFISFSCSDKFDDPQDTTAVDEERIKRYISENNLNASRTNSGLYHVIEVDSSSRRMPVASDVIEIAYKASLLETSEVFGEQDSYTFQPTVGSFMIGLTEGILLMGEGGKSTFLIPSHLAFGVASGILGGVSIPPNAIIVLEVEIKDIRSTQEQEILEDQLLKEYIQANNLTVTSDSLGVYRVVLKEGDSDKPVQERENVDVSYTGTFLDGSSFDSSQNFSFLVGSEGLIQGWNIGVMMMNREEKAIILVPSHRAYGAKGSAGGVPPFTPIIFTIDILR